MSGYNMYDINGDNWLDSGATDTSGDGIADQNALDTNGDQLADTWLLDGNQDGLAEARAYDLSGNGIPDVVQSDFDSNGIAERQVLDLDEDRVPDNPPPGNIIIGTDGSLVIGSPWANSPLVNLNDPAVVDHITGPFGDDIVAELQNGPAHSGGTAGQPVDGVDIATGLANLDAAGANTAGTVPTGTTQEYDPSSGGTVYYEPGDSTPDPHFDGSVDGY